MEQRLVQSPQMIQAMQILQLSTLDLMERIEQELMENPFLEPEEQTPEEPDRENAKQERGEERGDERSKALESMIDELERYERDFGDGRSRTLNVEASDRKLEAMQNTPDRHQSLAEALMDQLAFVELDERHRDIAEFLVYSLDRRGWLPEPLDTLVEQCDVPDVTLEELREILGQIRRAAHPAIGSADLRECLQLEVEALGVEDPLVRTLIDEHLEDITTNRLPRIARDTGHTLEEVKNAIAIIRHLDPNPGREFGGSPAQVIAPDVVVEEIDGEYVVRLARQRTQELTVSPSYRQILRQADGENDPEGNVQKWVRKRVESARWFIEAIHQRRNTMLRIADSVFRRQRDFLDKGLQGLKPLRMQEVADEAGVHISTVSRAVAGKYAQTPRGIFPLKFFFTGGTKKAGGGMASQAGIKQRIKELVEQEDPENPLSDDQLAELLAQKDGIRIARRTVTKYRKALSLPASTQRRVF
jgi:RNA polymerase sigma-54 factor